MHQQTKPFAGTARAAAIVLLIIGMSGCGKPPIPTQHFILEYPSPVFGAKPTLAESIKVERFGAAQTINSNNMVYLPRPTEMSAYVYNKWQVDPGNMVTDFLLRDLRKANLFKGVFGHQQSGLGRFKVEGAVHQFAEVDEPDGWKAVLAVTVTMLDITAPEVTKRVIFQKVYRQAEPLPEHTPAGLAQGMSRAMEAASAQIINDLYTAATRVCR